MLNTALQKANTTQTLYHAKPTSFSYLSPYSPPPFPPHNLILKAVVSLFRIVTVRLTALRLMTHSGRPTRSPEQRAVQLRQPLRSHKEGKRSPADLQSCVCEQRNGG